jgi:hypothetical protein
MLEGAEHVGGLLIAPVFVLCSLLSCSPISTSQSNLKLFIFSVPTSVPTSSLPFSTLSIVSSLLVSAVSRSLDRDSWLHEMRLEVEVSERVDGW